MAETDERALDQFITEEGEQEDHSDTEREPLQFPENTVRAAQSKKLLHKYKL
jgi:hypothetical protein